LSASLNGTQLAYHLPISKRGLVKIMRTLDLMAAAMLALGIREILRTSSTRRERTRRREAIQTWEDEGGAVPVSRSATAAQVSPPPDAALHY
jgi:hypothetical protein